MEKFWMWLNSGGWVAVFTGVIAVCTYLYQRDTRKLWRVTNDSVVFTWLNSVWKLHLLKTDPQEEIDRKMAEIQIRVNSLHRLAPYLSRGTSKVILDELDAAMTSAQDKLKLMKMEKEKLEERLEKLERLQRKQKNRSD